MASYGGFAQCTRFLLAIINVIFLILGLTVFITACVLRWGSTGFSKLINIEEISTLIEGASSINAITIFFLVIGGFIILLSLFGILGVKYMNRFFLIVYEIIIVCLFLAQIVAILVLVFSSSSIESEYRKSLNNTMDAINKDKDIDENCKLFKSISDVFHCCGINGPSDFVNQTLVTSKICCKDYTGDYSTGCADKSINSIEDNVVSLIVIPSSIILGIEFFAMVTVPFLVGKAGAKHKHYYDD